MSTCPGGVHPLPSSSPAGRNRLQANIDLYNVLNANFVATRNGNYGTNGATWLRPGAILPARLLFLFFSERRLRFVHESP